MNSPHQTTSTAPPGNLAFGCLGAILIHPLLFVLAFLKGFVLGSAQEMVMSATGGSGPTKYLFEGGLNAMGNLAIGYLFVGFIIFPIASLLGAGLAILIKRTFINTNRNPLKIELVPKVTQRLALTQRFAWVFLVADLILSVYWVAVVSIMLSLITSILACLQASKVFKTRTYWVICLLVFGCLTGTICNEVVFFIWGEELTYSTFKFLSNADFVFWFARIIAVLFVFVRVMRVLSENRNRNAAVSI